MLCEKCEILDLKAMKALESLTPSGSEFVNDVERCVAHIRDTQRSIVHFAKRAKSAREALTNIQLLLETQYAVYDKAEVFDEMEQRLQEVSKIVQEALEL